MNTDYLNRELLHEIEVDCFLKDICDEFHVSELDEIELPQ